jgi:hypothetical protein
MAEYQESQPLRISDRRQPIGYHLWNFQPPINLHVVGHYETACGGCDTISSIDQVYQEVQAAAKHVPVLYEGIMVSGESRRCIELHRAGFPVTVIALDTDINTCLDAILERRKARGDTRPLNPDRTIRRLGEVRRMMEHLKVAGVPTLWLDREAAYQETRRLLRSE